MVHQKSRERYESERIEREAAEEARRLILDNAFRDQIESETVNRVSSVSEIGSEYVKRQALITVLGRDLYGSPDTLWWRGQILVDGRGRGALQK